MRSAQSRGKGQGRPQGGPGRPKHGPGKGGPGKGAAGKGAAGKGAGGKGAGGPGRAHAVHGKGAGPAQGAGQAPGGIVSLPSLSVIYLNIPKSACTSVKNHLYFLHTGRYSDQPLDIHKESLLKSKGADAEERESLRRRIATRSMAFTFVRHPGKRAYSCFGEKICTTSPYSFPRIREYLIRHYGVDFSGYDTPDYTLQRHRENYIRYLDFVRDNVAGRTNVRQDPHWGLQTDVIASFQRFLVIDFIGRVERFADDLRFALRAEPKAENLDWSRKFNEGPPPPFPYEDVATPDVRDLMVEVFRRDYERLAYAP